MAKDDAARMDALARLASELERATTALADARQEAGRLAGERDALQAEASGLRTALASERTALAQRDAELAILRPRAISCAAALAAVMHEADTIHDALLASFEEERIATEKLAAANAALARLNTGLEAEVAARTTELNEANAALTRLVAALQIAVYTTDREGRLTFYNEAAATLWGRRPALGDPGWSGARRILYPDGGPMPPEQMPIVRALREDRAIPGQEAMAERQDGTRIHVLAYPAPLRDAAGVTIGAVNVLVDITDRKAAEATLSESEARFRTLISSIDEGYSLGELVLDADGRPVDLRCLEANPQFHAIAGRCDLVGLTATELWPKLEPRWIETFAGVALGGDPLRFELDRAGTDRAFDMFAMPVAPRGRFVVIFRDITARRAQERERQRMADQQRAILDALPAHVALLDPAGRIVAVNAAWQRFSEENGAPDLAGTGPGVDYLAVCRSAATSGDTAATGIVDGLTDVLAGRRQRFEIAYNGRAPGQSPQRWFRLLAAPVLTGATGAVAGAVTMHIDITERMRDAQALAESESRLRAMLDAVPDAVVLIDERGTIESFSATAERMFGWPAADTLGRNVAMLMPSPDREGHDGYLARYLATAERRVADTGRVTTGQRRDGTLFPVELALGEARFDGRRLFIGFVRDITEREATKARLQALQAELLHISRVSEAGAMASALAHELNQPLTSMTSAVRAAQRMLASPEPDAKAAAPQALGLAAEQALRAGEIIRHLREFVTRGEVDQQLEVLPRLIEEAGALALVGARQHGIQVAHRLDPDLPAVLVDRVQIQQVLFNLIRNAVQAMTQEAEDACTGRPCELVVAARLRQPDMVEVSVSDTGPGLAPNVAARLFEPFVTTKPDGMGIGLSISRTVIEAHGGRIWAEPNPGGGTVFHFTLPAGPSPDGQAAAGAHG